MPDDDLRGSAPIYTAKDVLVALDKRVESMDAKFDQLNTALQVLLSQDLNARVLKLEREGSEQAQTAAKQSIINREAIAAMQLRVAVASGAVMVIVVIINILAPVLQHWLGIPGNP